MKFKKLLLLILSISVIAYADAQLNGNCPGCVYNSAQFGTNINAFSVGLFPDSIVITQDDTVDIDVTYLLPQEASTGISIAPTATVEEVQILGFNVATPLPGGLSVTCDSSTNGCQYFPQVNRFGCVKICGVTAQAATNGYVLAQVTVAGTGTAAGQTQTQQQNINFYYKILPDTAACHTVCFQNKINTGCDSATFGIYAGIDITCADPILNPCSFDWAFGNGTTGSGLTPQSATYTAPGAYPVTLTQNKYALVIDSASLSTLSGWSNICNLFGLDGSANAYQLNFSIGSNNYSTPSGGSGAQTYSGLNDTVTNQAVAIVVQDNCALSTLTSNTATLTVTGPGSYAWAVTGSDAASGFIYVSQVLVGSTSYTDSAYIYASPDTPAITASLDSICAGDSVLLSIGTQFSGYNILWYLNDTVFLSALGDTSTSGYVQAAGNYSVKVTNPATHCFAYSGHTAIAVSSFVPQVAFIYYNSGLQELYVDPFMGGNMAVWYFDSTLVSGQNGQFLPNLGSGNYYATVYPGGYPQCSATSPVYSLNLTNINEIPDDISNLLVFPNPSNGMFSVRVNVMTRGMVNITLTDMLGRVVYQNAVANQTGEVKDNINVSGLAKDVYTLEVSTDHGMMTKRVVVD